TQSHQDQIMPNNLFYASMVSVSSCPNFVVMRREVPSNHASDSCCRKATAMRYLRRRDITQSAWQQEPSGFPTNCVALTDAEAQTFRPGITKSSYKILSRPSGRLNSLNSLAQYRGKGSTAAAQGVA